MINNNKRKITPYPIYSPSGTSTTLQSSNANIEVFKGKPFYCGLSSLPTTKGNFLPTTKSNCYFNHIIGLPVKNDIVHEIYDYEIEMQDAIEQNQHVWIKKARGIGPTEFLTRYLSWKALSLQS